MPPKNKGKNKGKDKAEPSTSQQPPQPQPAPPPTVEDQPWHGGALPEKPAWSATIKDSELKPHDEQSQQPLVFERNRLPGSANRIAELMRDPRLPHRTVACYVIAHTIISKVVKARAKTFRAMENKEAARDDFEKFSNYIERWNASAVSQVNQARDNVTATAGRASAKMMSDTTTFQNTAGKYPGKDFRVEAALTYKSGYKTPAKKTLAKHHEDFIKCLKDMAPKTYGAHYFNSAAEPAILSSGALLSTYTLRQLGLKTESNTTEWDKADLGNDDHVFFFLEYENRRMNLDTRFIGRNTPDGNVVPPDDYREARRISFPLWTLMQTGTWAMKQDFLSKKNLTLDLPHQDNIVAVADTIESHQQAREFMGQMAIAALRMPIPVADRAKYNLTSEKKQKKLEEVSAALADLLKMDKKDLFEKVFSDYLQPQLMVPSIVNINSHGAILDRWLSEAKPPRPT